MKLGPLEIALIIFVVIAVIIIARIIRPGRIASRNEDNTNFDTKSGRNTQKKSKRSSLLTRTGVALMAAGGITIIAGVSMLQWVLHNYVISIVLIACGAIIFFLSRQRR